jgi:cobalt-zinc-cadmium efflux system outer membrane protein
VYNPELEISASNADVDTRSVGIAQQIDWSGKRRARAAAADAETRAVEAERDSVRLRIALDFLRGAAALQVARDQVSLGAQRVEWLSKFSTLAQRRFRAGDIPVLERDFATLALQEARAQQAELMSDEAKARQMLIAVAGSVSEWPALPIAPPAVDDAAFAAASVEALPDVRKALAESEVAQARVTVAERERRADPTVAITGGRVTDGPFNDRLVGVTVRVPLFVRNSYRAETVAARASADAADFAWRDSRLRAAAQREQAKTSYDALRSAWLDWQGSHAAKADDRAALLQKLWEAGELSTTDTLVQLKQSLDTELAAAGVRARVWQAWADWLAASGGLAQWLDLDDRVDTVSKDVSP